MPDKLYPTRLTFADIQRSEYSAKTPVEGARMEFPGIDEKQYPCPKWDCENGFYKVLKPMGDGAFYWKEIPCPICGGKGYVPFNSGIGREHRASRAIGQDRDPRVYECVPVINQYERGDLP